jgi:flavodoxin
MSKYQIDYIDDSAATTKIATEIAKKLNAKLLNLSKDDKNYDADIHIIGFHTNKDTIPIDVLDYIENLEGKQILFYICDYFDASGDHRDKLEKRLLPFLPDECEYQGMFLCLEEMPSSTIDKISQLQKSNIDDEKIQFLIDKYNNAKGRPDEVDIYKLFNFIIENTD